MRISRTRQQTVTAPRRLGRVRDAITGKRGQAWEAGTIRWWSPAGQRDRWAITPYVSWDPLLLSRLMNFLLGPDGWLWPTHRRWR